MCHSLLLRRSFCWWLVVGQSNCVQMHYGLQPLLTPLGNNKWTSDMFLAIPTIPTTYFAHTETNIHWCKHNQTHTCTHSNKTTITHVHAHTCTLVHTAIIRRFVPVFLMLSGGLAASCFIMIPCQIVASSATVCALLSFHVFAQTQTHTQMIQHYQTEALL